MKIDRHEARKLMAQLRRTKDANGGNVDTVLLQDVVARILEHLETDQDEAGGVMDETWVTEQERWYRDMEKMWIDMARTERRCAMAYGAAGVLSTLSVVAAWVWRCGGTVDVWPIIAAPGLAYYAALWQWMEAARTERNVQRVRFDYMKFQLDLLELRGREKAREVKP